MRQKLYVYTKMSKDPPPPQDTAKIGISGSDFYGTQMMSWILKVGWDFGFFLIGDRLRLSKTGNGET